MHATQDYILRLTRPGFDVNPFFGRSRVARAGSSIPGPPDGSTLPPRTRAGRLEPLFPLERLYLREREPDHGCQPRLDHAFAIITPPIATLAAALVNWRVPGLLPMKLGNFSPEPTISQTFG
jgi:hypothetical protein